MTEQAPAGSAPPAPTTRPLRSAGVAPAAVVAVAAGLVLLVVAVVAVAADVPLGDITRDAAAVSEVPWYVGALSSAGFAVWGVGIGAAVLGGLLARRAADRATARLLLQAAALTALLLLDDMLELHEVVLDAVSFPEALAYAAYAVLAGLWLVGNRRTLLRGEWALLLGSLLLFAGSVVIDQAFETGDLGTYAEDSLKLLGAVLWSTWLLRTALAALPSSTSDRRTG